MTTAVPVAQPDRTFVTNVRNVAAVKGFYWGTDTAGAPHHHWEGLLGRIETAATPVLSAVLDHPVVALPPRWPLPNAQRARLAWWMAAQLLRTTRQRKRLSFGASRPELLEPSPGVRSFVRNNDHLRFIADHLSSLAWALHNRPWAIVFSDACLGTSDVPVVVANGQDADDQLFAAAYWDVFMPLDPHRLLLLPCLTGEDDPAKRMDHRAKLPGALGTFVTELLYDAADTHLFHHPDHQPLMQRVGKAPRLPTPWTGDTKAAGPQYAISYGVLHGDFNVEARWLTEHPPRRAS